jgi:hypothetical protein
VFVEQLRDGQLLNDSALLDESLCSYLVKM